MKRHSGCVSGIKWPGTSVLQLRISFSRQGHIIDCSHVCHENDTPRTSIPIFARHLSVFQRISQYHPVIHLPRQHHELEGKSRAQCPVQCIQRRYLKEPTQPLEEICHGCEDAGIKNNCLVISWSQTCAILSQRLISWRRQSLQSHSCSQYELLE